MCIKYSILKKKMYVITDNMYLPNINLHGYTITPIIRACCQPHLIRKLFNI